MNAESTMNRVDFDPRWTGHHGIGRFAQEVRSRLTLPDAPVTGRPLSALGLLSTTRRLLAYRDRYLYTPGFNGTAAGGGRMILSVMDLIHLREPAEASASRTFYYNRFIRPVVRAAPRVITISEFSRAEIANWADVDPQKIINVSCGCGAAFILDGPVRLSSTPYFLYVGNAKPHKNLSVLTAACRILSLQRPIGLVIIGISDPTEMSSLRKLANLPIEFYSGIDDSQLAAFYRGATATVQPSRIEGFGLPIVESLACGCPVIASNSTSMPEAGGEAVEYFDSNDTDALVDLMAAKLDDPDRSADAVGRRTRHAATFTWDAVAQRIAAALASI